MLKANSPHQREENVFVWREIGIGGLYERKQIFLPIYGQNIFFSNEDEARNRISLLRSYEPVLLTTEQR